MKITSEILDKYAKNNCTTTEKEAVELWLESPLENETESPLATSKFLEHKLWHNIQQKTTAKRKRKMWWAVAASIVLLISLDGYHQFLNPNKIITYHTLAGEKETIILSDGTKIYLNANSSFSAPRKFTRGTRMVTLKGEAYFEVTKDSLQPFIIHTSDSKTTVLGTKFNLTAYQNEPTILTLNEGKVAFNNLNHIQDALVLLPNEQGRIDSKQLSKIHVNPKRYNGWIDNHFYFNNDSVLSIIHKIERAYGVSIQTTNKKLLTQRYRGSYKNPSLNTLLNDLSFVLRFKYQIKNRLVTIY